MINETETPAMTTAVASATAGMKMVAILPFIRLSSSNDVSVSSFGVSLIRNKTRQLCNCTDRKASGSPRLVDGDDLLWDRHDSIFRVD